MPSSKRGGIRGSTLFYHSDPVNAGDTRAADDSIESLAVRAHGCTVRGASLPLSAADGSSLSAHGSGFFPIKAFRYYTTLYYKAVRL